MGLFEKLAELSNKLRLKKPVSTDGKLIIDKDGWLRGPNVVIMKADPSWYSKGLPGTFNGEPLGPLWHWTDTKPGTAVNMAKARQKKFKKGVDREASWNITFEEDGKIYQMVSLLDRTWHCRKQCLLNGKPVAYQLNGIELIGFGKEYSDKLLASVQEFMQAGVDRFGWKLEDCWHEHRHFDPERRTDCGPPWSDKHLPDILAKVKWRKP